jgi:hypothetical protein
VDKIFSRNSSKTDCRLFIASIAGIYAPLVLILTAALTLF